MSNFDKFFIFSKSDQSKLTFKNAFINICHLARFIYGVYLM